MASITWYIDGGNDEVRGGWSQPWENTFAFFLSKSQYPKLSCDIKLGSLTNS
jgi:hypothetical protein